MALKKVFCKEFLTYFVTPTAEKRKKNFFLSTFCIFIIEERKISSRVHSLMTSVKKSGDFKSRFPFFTQKNILLLSLEFGRHC